MKRTPYNSGLTLVELLVVLTILVVLTGIAAQSVTGVADQSRFEATQRTLVNVRAAIVGNESNSLDPLTGFVADMGRLPISLDELLTAPNDASVYGLQAGPSPFTDVLVPRGWRGPYVRLPVGSLPLGMNHVRDGWSVPLVSNQPMPLSFIAVSLAANRSASNTAYNTDLAITIAPNDWQATLITGTMYRGVNSTDTWSVTLIAPGPANINNGVHQTAAIISTAANGDMSYTIANELSIGPRVLRAIKNGSPFGNPLYLTLRPGATHVVNFHHE